MKDEKELTGYPHIDKPWMKYYDKEKLEDLNIKRTVYQEILENNKNYLSDLSLEFFLNKINYETLFKNIYKTVKSLREYNIKKGDVVSFCLAGIPETVYAFYACSYIGAIGNFMTPNMYPEDMVANINNSESKIVFVMDKFYEKIKDSIYKSNVKNVVIVPTLNSSILRHFSPKFKLQKSNELFYNQFIKDGKNHELLNEKEYEKNIPLAVVYSSGTTGRYKGIVLSNDSFQNSVHAYNASGVDVTRGLKFYQIIPPWVSTGLSTSLHLPLTYGVSVFMDPRFEREVFVKNIIKNKINYAVATTTMYEGFLDEKLVHNKTWPFINYPFQGGEPLSTEKNERLTNQFLKHGCSSKIRTAYGQCECGAAITTQTQKIDHPSGSSGIPIPGVVVGIFDDNGKELKYNTRGNIWVNTNCGMLGYYNNKELTDKYFYFDKAGTKWSLTGDVGYIDINGNLFVEGRAKDCTIVNNKKIFNFDIEKIILEDKKIKDCDVVSKFNDDGTQNLFAHIIYKEEFNNVNLDIEKDLQVIQEKIWETYHDSDMIPILFKIRDEFPCAMSGKRDIKLMQTDTENIIEIDFHSLKLIRSRKK